MRWFVSGLMFISAAQSAAIANLKVATETGSGTLQFIVAVFTFIGAIIVVFNRSLDR